jgi:hypothetical protein
MRDHVPMDDISYERRRARFRPVRGGLVALARPVAALSAAAVLLSGAVGAPALAGAAAAGDGAWGSGSARTSLKLLDVSVGAQRLEVLQLALVTGLADGATTASGVVTPLTVDGAPYGRQSVSGRSAAVPSVRSSAVAPAAARGLVDGRSPEVQVTARDGSSRASADSLGGVSVLGLPVALQGAVELSSTVGADGSAGSKTVTVTDLALPGLADLLGALGLDLAALPVDSLTELLDRLDLTDSSVEQARQALDEVLGPVAAEVDRAQAEVAGTAEAVHLLVQEAAKARSALADASNALDAATAALGGDSGSGLLYRSQALEGLEPVLAPVQQVVQQPVQQVVQQPVQQVVQQPVQEVVASPAPRLNGGLDAALQPVLDPVVDPVVEPVVDAVVDGTGALPVPSLPAPSLPGVVTPEQQPLIDAYTAARASYDAALAAARTLDEQLAAARRLLAGATAALDTLLAPARPQLEAVTGAAVGLLDATPLVALDRLEVHTLASVTGAGPHGQRAEVVGGRVEGLRVLGTDVLEGPLGRGPVSVTALSGAGGAVDDAIGALTGALSQVLSDVPGLPALQVPAPRIELLSTASATDVIDGVGRAGTAVRALTVTWPGLAVPAAVAVPDAVSLPGVATRGSALAGGLPTLPGTLAPLSTDAAGGAADVAVDVAVDVVSRPLRITLATLEDRAEFRPAAAPAETGTPAAPTPGAAAPSVVPAPAATSADGAPDGATTSTGSAGPADSPAAVTAAAAAQLPRTGGAPVPALAAALLVGAALLLHRRRPTA